MISLITDVFLRPRLSRHELPAAAAIIGGVCWSILPLLYFYVRELHAIGIPIQYAHSLLPAIAVPLLLIGLRGFYNRYGQTYSTLGRGGLWGLGIGLLGLWPLGMIGFLSTSFDISISFARGFWVIPVAVVGVVVIELGATGVGVDAWKTDTPSRWMGVWFPLLLPASILVNYYLGFATSILPNIGGHYYSGLFGLAWIGLGYFLWR